MPDSVSNGVESIIGHLFCQEGYTQKGDILFRPDGSMAAEFIDGTWRPYVTPEEFSLYMVTTGRGFPSKLAIQDPTNPGHASHPDMVRFYPTRDPIKAQAGLTPCRDVKKILHEPESGLLRLIYRMAKV